MRRRAKVCRWCGLRIPPGPAKRFCASDESTKAGTAFCRPLEGACEVCGQTAGNESPFKLEDGRRLNSVCGGCKIRLTLTPKTTKRLEGEIRQALEATAPKRTALERACDEVEAERYLSEQGDR